MKAKPKKPKIEDEEQSRRFLELAKELQDAGELNPTDEGEALERAVKKLALARKPPSG